MLIDLQTEKKTIFLVRRQLRGSATKQLDGRTAGHLKMQGRLVRFIYLFVPRDPLQEQPFKTVRPSAVVCLSV